jgi:2-keto-4-pentenoate hydratase
MTSDKLDKAADLLTAARVNAAPLNALPAELQPQSIDESYALQERLNDKLANELQPAVGFKIGCTTTVMQEYLGIAHPCKGVIFESTVHHGHGDVYANKLCRPGVECEIAVQLAHDMPADTHYEAANCHRFVDAAFCSIELVDDRWQDYRTVSTQTLIAENFFGAGCVFGAAVKLEADALPNTRGTLWINGERIGSGLGADILDHPYNALAWLANHQAERSTPLAAGDYVSLGSVVKTCWLNAGDKVEIEFSDLGRCSLQLHGQ